MLLHSHPLNGMVLCHCHTSKCRVRGRDGFSDHSKEQWIRLIIIIFGCLFRQSRRYGPRSVSVAASSSVRCSSCNTKQRTNCVKENKPGNRKCCEKKKVENEKFSMHTLTLRHPSAWPSSSSQAEMCTTFVLTTIPFSIVQPNNNDNLDDRIEKKREKKKWRRTRMRGWETSIALFHRIKSLNAGRAEKGIQ